MIDILLSTYNGEKYLAEQLDSVLNQTNKDWRLIIRDDCSADDTLNIISKYVNSYPQKITLLTDDRGNVGSKLSFENLLQASTSDYIMFCDQDDVWLPEKVELTYKRMLELENQYGKEKPILVHTDLLVVDEHLQTISESFFDYCKIDITQANKNLQWFGLLPSVTGCTMMINKATRKISLPFYKNSPMHDWYISDCVKKYGIVSTIKTATIKYRQHGSNVYGAKTPDKVNLALNGYISKFKEKYQLNKSYYMSLHPLVFKTPLSFLYYRIRCALYLAKRK